METTQDKLKRSLFSCDMPDMPQKYREFFNVAFMFRRKYLNISTRSPENTYEAAVEDMRAICEAYGNDPFCMALLIDCYEDIAQSIDKETANAANQPKQCRMAV